MCLLRQGGSDRFGSASENYMHRIQVRTWIAELGERRSTRSSVLQPKRSEQQATWRETMMRQQQYQARQACSTTE